MPKPKSIIGTISPLVSLPDVAKDIIQAKITPDMTLLDVEKVFYKLMRKHGIKQGTKTEDGGIQQNNFEWTICKTLFMDCIATQFKFMEWGMLGFSGTPKQLKHY